MSSGEILPRPSTPEPSSFLIFPVCYLLLSRNSNLDFHLGSWLSVYWPTRVILMRRLWYGRNRMTRAEDFESSAWVRKSIISHQGRIFYRKIELIDATDNSHRIESSENADRQASLPSGFCPHNMGRADSCPRGPRRSKYMSPPASTASLLLYADGNRLFNARPTVRFSQTSECSLLVKSTLNCSRVSFLGSEHFYMQLSFRESVVGRRLSVMLIP